MSNRTRAFFAAGALAVAALAAPLTAAMSSGDTAPTFTAQCRAVFGSRNDGVCLDGDSITNFEIGTPSYCFGNGDDCGFSTGPLLPGTTITKSIGGN